MTSGEKGFAAGLCIGLILAVLAVTLSVLVCADYWHVTLIRRGHAEYNQQTGAWQWKEPQQ